MDTFILPVEGLSLSEDWTVGPVNLLSPQSRDRLLTSVSERAGAVGTWPTFESARASLQSSTAAVVDAEDIDNAIELVLDALAVVRVFHDRTRLVKGTPTFGLAGEVFERQVRYLCVQQNGQYGAGFANRGDTVGFTFTSEAHRAWLAQSDLQFAASAIGAAGGSGGARQALLGCKLLSEAILDHQPDAKLRTLITALEVLVGDGGGKYALARRVAYLACGAIAPGEGLCGRARPTCPYLHLDPGDRRQRGKLDKLRERAATEAGWLCSEWNQVVDWYDSRNDAAHGGLSGLSHDEVGKIQYWITRYVSPLALAWLRDNADSPTDALAEAIEALPEPPDWDAIIGAGADASA